MDAPQLPPPPEGWSVALGGLNTSSGRGVFAITLLFIVLAWVSIGLRIWGKQVRRRKFELHDYLAFAALPFSTGFGIALLVGVVHAGIGLHIVPALSLLGPHATVVLLKVYFSGSIVWTWATCLIKLSILNLYIRIFERRWFRITSYILSVLVVCFGIAFFLLDIFSCLPVAYNWDKTIVGGKCLDSLPFQLSTAAINAALDAVIAVLPLSILWGLKMPHRKKVLVTCLITLGPIICMMNIARIISEVKLDQNDATFAFGVIGILAGLETWVGIIAACLPTYGVLLFEFTEKRNFSKGFFSMSRKSGNTQLIGGASNDSSRSGKMMHSLERVSAPSATHASSDGESLDTMQFTGSNGGKQGYAEACPATEQQQDMAHGDEVVNVKTVMSVYKSGSESRGPR